MHHRTQSKVHDAGPILVNTGVITAIGSINSIAGFGRAECDVTAALSLLFRRHISRPLQRKSVAVSVALQTFDFTRMPKHQNNPCKCLS
jgi:hypothetical protein